MQAATASLELAEGVELAYALVAKVAEDVGARALAIKGRVNEAHGLREPRASVDADVLVDPVRIDDVVDALLAAGWRKAPAPPVPPPFGAHSVTLNNPGWPCELDLHDRFPGFLADPLDVFETLWAERTIVPLAGGWVNATGLYGSALVMALHAVRTPGDPRNGRELDGLVERLSARTIRRDRLWAMAAATGSLSTARPFLTRLGIQVADAEADDQGVALWELRRSMGQTDGLGWVVAFRRTPPWRWPGMLAAALLSTEALLRRHYPSAPPGRRGLWLARWWRLKRAVRALPRALRTARRLG